MVEERDFERLRELTPRQLWMELAAAYEALAAQEVEIRGLRSSLAELWNEGEQYMAEGRIDHLTGALNRRGVEIALTDEMSFARRFESPLSVIAIDVDHFKETNDTYGHPAGDTVLQEIVRRARKVLRPYDSIGRIGGDELTIILRGATLKNATLVAERICAAIALNVFSYGEATFRVTISVGVAVAEREAKQTLEAADEALYEAKRSGRNRVVAINR